MLLVNWELFHLFPRKIMSKIWRTGVGGMWSLICSGLVNSTGQHARVLLSLAPPPCAGAAF